MTGKPTYEELEQRVRDLETALKKSEERYLQLYVHAPVMVHSIDPEGVLLDVSEFWLEKMGYERSDVIGRKSIDFLTEASRQKAVDLYLPEFFKSGHIRDVPYQMVKKNGEIIDVLLSAISEKNENREITRTFAVCVDISERNKIVDDLKKNESLFRGLYEYMTSGSAIYEVRNDGSKGSDYIVKNFNRTSLEIENRTLEQVIGKSLLDLRPSIDEYGLIPVMKKVWETGEPAYFPTKIYQDKTYSNYYENYIFRIPTGEVVTIYNDVTDQKMAEAALKESEKRFKLAMEFANDGLFDWDLKTGQIYYSPVWKRLLGYEEDELPNDFSVWETLTHPEDVKRSWKMQNELINRRRDKFEIEFKMKHKDGHWVDILARANAIFDENHQAVRIIGTHVDISERKALEKKLLQSQKLEAIGNLAGGIAHDFNNILSSIIGFTELALDEVPKGSSLEDNLQEVYSAGKRAKDLVKQILAFARQSDEKKGPIQPGQIVKEVLKLIRSTIPATIDIQQDIDSDSLILGNATQFHQVLMNLCTNAASAMEDSGGILKVGVKDVFLDKKELSAGMRPEEHVRIEVSDTGVGIAPEIIGAVFEPYFTTKRAGEGTGMGLAMVHGIVESYGGRITVDSQLKVGTTFTVYLPITNHRSGHDASLPERVPTGTEQILFVDDEAPIARMGSQMLGRLGYSVTTRTSSIEALELFRARPNDFDLVVTDMTMPNLTGDRLAVELMKIRRDIPVILCTGYSKKISEETASEMGIKAFAYKPVVKADLAKTIRKVLDQTKNKLADYPVAENSRDHWFRDTMNTLAVK